MYVMKHVMNLLLKHFIFSYAFYVVKEFKKKSDFESADEKRIVVKDFRDSERAKEDEVCT